MHKAGPGGAKLSALRSTEHVDPKRARQSIGLRDIEESKPAKPCTATRRKSQAMPEEGCRHIWQWCAPTASTHLSSIQAARTSTTRSTRTILRRSTACDMHDVIVNHRGPSAKIARASGGCRQHMKFPGHPWTNDGPAALTHNAAVPSLRVSACRI